MSTDIVEGTVLESTPVAIVMGYADWQFVKAYVEQNLFVCPDSDTRDRLYSIHIQEVVYDE